MWRTEDEKKAGFFLKEVCFKVQRRGRDQDNLNNAGYNELICRDKNRDTKESGMRGADYTI